MARFEKGDQFVEYWTEQGEGPIDPATGQRRYVWPELFTRSGKLGTSAGEAMALALPHAFSAYSEYSRYTRELLEQGWRRVSDRAHDTALPDEPSEPSLDAQLRVDPGDADVALIYADWLQLRGHPRGKLIAVQAALRTRPGDPELLEAQRALLEEHADVLLGPLAALAAGGDDPEMVELEWDLGWIRRVKIVGRSDEPADLAWEVLRHPSAKFLRSFIVGRVRSGDQDNSTLTATIMRMEPKPPLRELEIADFDHSEIDSIDISRARIGDLTGLGRAYPELETVILKGTGDVGLGRLALPRAKKFALRTSTMMKRTLAAILAAPWPALEDLELWFGEIERGYGAECTLDDVLPLFAKQLPALRALRIMNAMFSDEIVPAIAAWPGAARLEELDFSLGTLSDAGAKALAASRAAFPRLTRLGVFECALTGAGLSTLYAAGYPVDTKAISPAESWREPQQKQGRYCSVGE